jgi:transcriptional regulator with XRE-family HTH domain
MISATSRSDNEIEQPASDPGAAHQQAIEPSSAGPPESAPEAGELASEVGPGARAEANPTDGIGERVADLRSKHRLKVTELARLVGVSPSLISQIERGQSRPSVSTLFALSEALQVPIDAFFNREDVGSPAESFERSFDHGTGESQVADQLDEPPPGERRYLVRRDARAAVDIEGGVRWERLTPTTLDHIDFMELVYGPGAQSHETLYRHPGTEMVLVTSGQLDIYVGFDHFRLQAGDSIHFPSSRPHRYANSTRQVARAVTVILHDDVPPPNKRHRRP